MKLDRHFTADERFIDDVIANDETLRLMLERGCACGGSLRNANPDCERCVLFEIAFVTRLTTEAAARNGNYAFEFLISQGVMLRQLMAGLPVNPDRRHPLVARVLEATA